MADKVLPTQLILFDINHLFAHKYFHVLLFGKKNSMSNKCLRYNSSGESGECGILLHCHYSQVHSDYE